MVICEVSERQITCFITKDISEPYLLKAIKVISSGEIWMTRVTVAKVFEEYGRMMKGGEIDKG